MSKQIYAVNVIFYNQGYWSKPHTYKSDILYQKGDLVVVPTNAFYGVGKVSAVSSDYEFNKDISYRYILHKVFL